MPEAPWVFFNWNRPGRCLWITYVQGGAHTGQRVWVWPALGLLSVSLRNCKFTSQASIKYRITTCLMSICLGLALTTSCLSVRLYVGLFVCLSFSLFVSLSICLSACRSVCLSVYLSVCLSLCVCLSVQLSYSLLVYLSFPVSVCLSLDMSVCPYVCPLVSLSGPLAAISLGVNCQKGFDLLTLLQQQLQKSCVIVATCVLTIWQRCCSQRMSKIAQLFNKLACQPATKHGRRVTLSPCVISSALSTPFCPPRDPSAPFV